MAQNTIVTKLLLETAGFTSAMKRASNSAKQFGQQMFRAGRDLSAALTLPLALIAKSALETASNFELAQTKIAALSGKGGQFKELSASARQLGANTIFTAEEISNLQLNLKKLGKSKEDILALQGSILKFAQALDTDLAGSGEFVVQTINRFSASLKEVGEPAEQAAYVTDLFAAAAANSAVDAEKLRAALNYVGSEAAAAGFKLDETTAIIGLLADRGFDASRGGTALRRVMAELAKEGLSAEETIDALLDTSKGYRAELEQFGLRGGGPAAALGGLRFEYEILLDTLRNSEGFLDNVADSLDDTLFASFKKVASAANEASIAFGTEFAPTIKNVALNLASFFKRISALPKPVKAFIVGIGATAAALGPLALAVGAVTLAVGTLGTAIAANPLLAAASAILALGTSLSLLKTPLDEQSEKYSKLAKNAAEASGYGLDVVLNSKLTNTELLKIQNAQNVINKSIEKRAELEEKIRNSAQINRDGSRGYLQDKQYVDNLTKSIKEARDSIAEYIAKLEKAKKKSEAGPTRPSNFLGFFPTEQLAADKARQEAAEEKSSKEQLARLQRTNELRKREAKLIRDNVDLFKKEENSLFFASEYLREALGVTSRWHEGLERADKAAAEITDNMEDFVDDEAIDEWDLMSEEDAAAVIKRFEFLKQALKENAAQFRAIAESIGDAFADTFYDAATGAKTFAESLKDNLLEALGAVIKKVIALTIAFAILSVASGGLFGEGIAGIASAALDSQKLGSFVLGGFGLTDTRSVTVNGSLAGTDIVLTNQRAGSALNRIYG